MKDGQRGKVTKSGRVTLCKKAGWTITAIVFINTEKYENIKDYIKKAAREALGIIKDRTQLKKPHL